MPKALPIVIYEPRNALILLILASLIALATAFTSQYVFGLAPCKLCIYQRWPYGIVIVLGVLALLLPGRLRVAILVSAAVAMFADTAIAIYHVGIEQMWWQGPSDCSANVGAAKSLEELRKQLMATAPVRCDEIAWSLLGISFAGYNAILSFLLGLYAIAVCARSQK